MKRFLKTVRECTTPDGFVERFQHTSRKTAIGYFYKLHLLLSLVLYIPLLFLVGAGVVFIAKTDIIGTYYPHGLEVKIENGAVSTNVEEPYFVKNTFSKNSSHSPAHANMLVIDTHATDTLSAFQTYDTMGLLTKEWLVTQDKNGKVSATSLKRITHTTISESSVRGFVKTMMPYFILGLVVLLILTPFMIAGGAMLMRLLWAFLAALCVRMIASSHTRPMSYRDAYVLSLFIRSLINTLDAVSE